MRRAVEAGGSRHLHLFEPGIRFDTQLEFWTGDAVGRKAWRKLPTPETSREGSGWVALMQAAALLRGKVPGAKAIARATRADLPPLAPGDFLVRMSALANGIEARWRPSNPHPSGEAVRTIACLSGTQGVSWALVVGWEQVQPSAEDLGRGSMAAPVNALLLLDPRIAAPWATAYNARLLLSTNRWLGLDGEVQTCELMGLIELRTP